MIGLVSCKQGKTAPPGQEVVDVGYRGIQKEVLTPGTYKINPHLYSVTLVPAVVVPPGYVGVTTRLTGDRGATTSVTLTEIRSQTSGSMNFKSRDRRTWYSNSKADPIAIRTNRPNNWSLPLPRRRCCCGSSMRDVMLEQKENLCVLEHDFV